ncbi:hypothetical protein [Actinoplanes derwentensis]|uniref:Uncharacterized protein n=1 Tax=Actinoplanes derwentensis TaxID=113562 RepID=A0A1H1SBP7_9ACTN|nr:hypothetical protein [Actinoplanes derwentensis]GID83340.1 hypothetical protein Ade03nite_22640 [Actinoplanes derwentensis]SDS45530.1 hypothetical protein SAMN04489716_0822 [Actinoplanes derwentensis]
MSRNTRSASRAPEISRPLSTWPLISEKVFTRKALGWTAAGVAAAVAVTVGVWALWPESPRQRVYLDATACLLTDNRGVTAEPAASVWATMQAASVDTLVRVQRLRVSDPQTPENAAGYLASLAGSRCGTIIAVGEAPAGAVALHAATFPDIPFITVGDGTPAPNVQVIDASATEEIQSAVREKLDMLADAVS